MKNFTFENQGTDTYLVYQVDKTDKIDTFAKGMLQNNTIEDILAPSFIQKDEEQYLKYNITSKIPLAEYFSEPMSRHKIIEIFLSMINGLESGEEYMLMQSGFLLDMKYIYVDISSRKANLLYLPLEEAQEGKSIRQFIKNTLIEINYDEHGNMDYIGKLINYINQTKDTGLKELKNYLEKLDKEGPGIQRGQSVQPTAVPQKNAEQRKVQIAKPAVSSVSPAGTPGGMQEAPAWTPRPQPVHPVNPVVQPPVQPAVQAPRDTAPYGSAPQEPSADHKKKGFGLFKGNSEKKAPKKAEKKEKGFFNFKGSGKSSSAPVEAMTSGTPPVPGGKAPGVPPVPGARTPGVPPIPGGKPPVVPPVLNKQPAAPNPGNGHFPNGSAEAPVPRFIQQAQPRPAVQPVPKFVSSQQTPIQPMRPVQPFMGGSSDEEDNRTIIIGGATDDENTMILDGGSARGNHGKKAYRAVITRRRNSQSMPITKNVFHIGKESSFADFYIGDNATISSAHADIVCDEGQYFVRDMNSLNHTYVNGTLVEAGEMRELHSGDVLKLSNEEFDFRIE